MVKVKGCLRRQVGTGTPEVAERPRGWGSLDELLLLAGNQGHITNHFISLYGNKSFSHPSPSPVSLYALNFRLELSRAQSILCWVLIWEFPSMDSGHRDCQQPGCL